MSTTRKDRKLPRFRFFTTAVITALAVYFTPHFALAQQCIDIFTKDVAPDGNSSISLTSSGDLLNKAAGMTGEAQFNLFVQIFDGVPSMRPFAARGMLRVAETNLKDHGVSYTKKITDKGGILLITPEETTPLNRFAKDIFDNYGAILQINPYLILASHERGSFTTYKEPTGSEAPSPALNLAWKHIADIDHVRFLRDPEFLNELRHLKTFHDLSDRKPSPFYGQITIGGRLPGELNPHIKEDSRIFFFDRIKIYHTYVKEELTRLRSLIHKKAPQEEINTQALKVKRLIGALNNISVRTGHALQEYLKPGNPLITGSIDIADYHIVVTIRYDDKQGNSFVIKMPLVHSISLYNPKNGIYTDRQMNWLYATVRNAVSQSATAAKKFALFEKPLTEESAIAVIDATQHALSTADLAPPEPN